MKKATIAIAVVFSFVAIVAVGSPYIALHQMRTAIKEQNADAFASHVDFVALRENLKLQIVTGMAKSMREQKESERNPFADFGKALGAALAGPMIDAMVTPAGIIALVRKPIKGRNNEAEEDKREYAVSFQSWDKILVRPKNMEGTDGTMTLRREGLWNWKLTAIELPSGALK